MSSAAGDLLAAHRRILRQHADRRRDQPVAGRLARGPRAVPSEPRIGSSIVPRSEQRIAAWACLPSSTAASVSAASLNMIPIDARVERIGVQATQPRPAMRVSPWWCSTIGTVLEHGEVRRLVLGAAEGLPVGVAEVVHQVVLVDDVPLEVHPPGPQHQVARAIEHVDAGALKPDPVTGQLDRAAKDQVRIVERVDLVEGRQQHGQLSARRPIHDLRDRCLRPEDDGPVHASPPRHSLQILLFPWDFRAVKTIEK